MGMVAKVGRHPASTSIPTPFINPTFHSDLERGRLPLRSLLQNTMLLYSQKESTEKESYCYPDLLLFFQCFKKYKIFGVLQKG